MRPHLTFWKSYLQFTFKGRMARKSYWFGMMIWSGIGQLFNEVTAWPWVQMLVGVALVALAFKCSLIARRLQDFGLSGWWQAPFISVLVVIMLANSFLTQEMINRLGLTSQEWILPTAIGGIVAYWLLVITVGLVPGSRQANRYGEKPAPEPIFGI
ncbi:DUF805 domain-containing protein [Caulobacter henricii]|uniref:DUF805 domain-containing protein n=1 Tax=Caulobacter henricii TaxID=69395 RepID=A0A0N7JH89_9CAUL|nr:DUF805 domain-containing protein [Caulobacter henricii]ALL12722.1 hypothetical protein AQ619_04765 [Caulobacter henricii]